MVGVHILLDSHVHKLVLLLHNTRQYKTQYTDIIIIPTQHTSVCTIPDRCALIIRIVFWISISSSQPEEGSHDQHLILTWLHTLIVDEVDDHIDDNESASPPDTSRAVNHDWANTLVLFLPGVHIFQIPQHSSCTTTHNTLDILKQSYTGKQSV